jgi:hypothetical protein
MLPKEYKQFQSNQKIFAEITNSIANTNNKALYNLYTQSYKEETFERLINSFTLLQKNVEDSLEARRLAFPRFFFMNDKQFIDCVIKSSKP